MLKIMFIQKPQPFRAASKRQCKAAGGERQVSWGLYSVAYLGYGRYVTCHGRHFDVGAKIAWKKLKL